MLFVLSLLLGIQADLDEVSQLQVKVEGDPPPRVADEPFRPFHGPVQQFVKQPGGIEIYEGPQRMRQALKNFEDIEYTGEIEVGGQSFQAIYDTGSFETLLMSKTCKSWSCSARDRYYDETRSQGYDTTGWTKQHSFGSGDMQSELCHDSMKVGPMMIQKSPFWKVVEASMPILQDGTFQAIIGVSNPNEPLIEIEDFLDEDKELYKKYETHHQPVPDWLRNQRKADREFKQVMAANPTFLKDFRITTFSVCFKQEVGSRGYWIWDDLKPSTLPVGMFSKIAVTGNTTWSAPLNAARLSGGRRNIDTLMACEHGHCSALVDTGTSLLTAPTAFINALLVQLQELNLSCDRLDEMPDLILTVNGVNLVIPPVEYIGIVDGVPMQRHMKYFPHLSQLHKDSEDKSRCTLMLMSMDVQTPGGDALWIVGMPIFRQYLVTFDLGNDGTYRSMKPERSMHFAKVQDDDCTHPADGRSLFKSKPNAPSVRRLNISNVRVPPWLERANHHKKLRL